jgi:hypothetical protein
MKDENWLLWLTICTLGAISILNAWMIMTTLKQLLTLSNVKKVTQRENKSLFFFFFFFAVKQIGWSWTPNPLASASWLFHKLIWTSLGYLESCIKQSAKRREHLETIFIDW